MSADPLISCSWGNSLIQPLWSEKLTLPHLSLLNWRDLFPPKVNNELLFCDQLSGQEDRRFWGPILPDVVKDLSLLDLKMIQGNNNKQDASIKSVMVTQPAVLLTSAVSPSGIGLVPSHPLGWNHVILPLSYQALSCSSLCINHAYLTNLGGSTAMVFPLRSLSPVVKTKIGQSF